MPTLPLLFFFFFATLASYQITTFYTVAEDSFYQCDLQYNSQKQQGEIIMIYVLKTEVDEKFSFWNLCV